MNKIRRQRNGEEGRRGRKRRRRREGASKGVINRIKGEDFF